MSEKAKLIDEFAYRHLRNLTMSDFIIAWGKLVERCKHEKTHWVQEMDSEGNLHNDLVKRCFVCGVNVDVIQNEKEFVEKLQHDWDTACEKKKNSLHSKKEV